MNPQIYSSFRKWWIHKHALMIQNRDMPEFLLAVLLLCYGWDLSKHVAILITSFINSDFIFSPGYFQRRKRKRENWWHWTGWCELKERPLLWKTLAMQVDWQRTSVNLPFPLNPTPIKCVTPLPRSFGQKGEIFKEWPLLVCLFCAILVNFHLYNV